MGVRVRFFDGAWYVFINHKGRRKARKIGTGPEGKAAADEAARRLEARLALGDVGLVQERQSVTLEAYASEWLDGYVRTNLSTGTHRVYTGIMANHWYPALGSRPITEISRQDIRKVITDKLRHGMTVTRARLVLNALQSCLNIAESEEIIVKNPLQHYSKWLIRPGHQSGKEQPKTVEIFTTPELKMLLGWFANEEPRWYPMVLLMARTGMRVGEALALQVEDLDFAERRIHVVRTWSGGTAEGGERFNTPKSHKPRWIDMSLQLKDVLLRYLAEHGLQQGWLFAHTADGLPMHPNNWRRDHWNKLFARHGTQLIAKRTPHALRHTFASILISRGHSLTYVRDQLGHASIKITADTYSHFVRGESKRAVDTLDDVGETSHTRKLYASEGITQLKVLRGGQS
jgi:integrase